VQKCPICAVYSLVEENTDNKKHVQIFDGEMSLKVVYWTSEKDARMHDIKILWPTYPSGKRVLWI
jgi:hypothetical protein